MNYKDALKCLKQNKNLIGETDGDFKITHIIIVPFDRQNQVEIISRAHLRKSYKDLITGFVKYRVLVVDLSKFGTYGILSHCDIDHYI